MNNHEKTLLVCTNGDEHSNPALEYGLWLATTLRWPLELLGVVEERKDEGLVIDLIQQAARKASQRGLTCTTRFEYGRAPRLLAATTCQGDYLTVVGPLGRPAWQRMLQGRSFRRIMARVATPLLYVPQARIPMGRMLVCLGGLGYTEALLQLSLKLARGVGAASIHLLHIVEPVTLDYPTARQVERRWQDILETDTPQAANLRLALEAARTAGLQADFKVRHGNIVHEILAEMASGEYDMVGLGSAFSAHSLRHLYMPNVTAEIAEVARCPLLTVRFAEAGAITAS